MIDSLHIRRSASMPCVCTRRVLSSRRGSAIFDGEVATLLQFGDAALAVMALDGDDPSEAGRRLSPRERAVLQDHDRAVDIVGRLIHRSGSAVATKSSYKGRLGWASPSGIASQVLRAIPSQVC